VLTVNPQLEDHPSIINEDPYNEGWLIEVRLKDDAELEDANGHGRVLPFRFQGQVVNFIIQALCCPRKIIETISNPANVISPKDLARFFSCRFGSR
jgi:hypothetical protein